MNYLEAKLHLIDQTQDQMSYQIKKKYMVHAIQQRGRRCWIFRVPMGYEYLVSGCPGPGCSWGKPAVPPPSNEGENPSNLFHSIPAEGLIV